MLLDRNADANYRCSRVCPDSVLKSACLSVDSDIIRLLVERGLILHDHELLHLFKVRGIAQNNEVATTLVEYVQDVNFALFSACCLGHAHIIRALLERGASLNLGCRYSDPLEIACRHGHIEVVKLMLGWNNENNRISQESVTDALQSASRYGYVDCASSYRVRGKSNGPLSCAL